MPYSLTPIFGKFPYPVDFGDGWVRSRNRRTRVGCQSVRSIVEGANINTLLALLFGLSHSLPRVSLQFLGIPFPPGFVFRIQRTTRLLYLQPLLRHLRCRRFRVPRSPWPVLTKLTLSPFLSFYSIRLGFSREFNGSGIKQCRYCATPWLSSPHVQTVFLNFNGRPPVFSYRRCSSTLLFIYLFYFMFLVQLFVASIFLG